MILANLVWAPLLSLVTFPPSLASCPPKRSNAPLPTSPPPSVCRLSLAVEALAYYMAVATLTQNPILVKVDGRVLAAGSHDTSDASDLAKLYRSVRTATGKALGKSTMRKKVPRPGKCPRRVNC